MQNMFSNTQIEWSCALHQGSFLTNLGNHKTSNTTETVNLWKPYSRVVFLPLQMTCKCVYYLEQYRNVSVDDC